MRTIRLFVLFVLFVVLLPMGGVATQDTETTQQIDENGIQITIPVETVGEVILEASPAIAEGTMFPRPEGRRITFTTYPIERDRQTAFIDVYPVAPFREMNSVAADELDMLSALLTDLTPIGPTIEQLPYISGVGAANDIAFKTAYIDFENGTGLRYITRFTQNMLPVTSDLLVYVYQGITDDGEYAVSVRLPFTTEILPDLDAIIENGTVALPDEYADDTDTLFTVYAAFNLGTAYTLHSASDDLFSPDIDVLDEMVRSLRVTTPAD